MSTIAEVRALVNDLVTPYRVSDSTLTVYLNMAQRSVNYYAKTSYNITDWTDTSAVVDMEPMDYNILLQMAQVYAVQSIMQNPAMWLKFQTQDTMRDPTNVQLVLDRTLKQLKSELKDLVTYVYATDAAAYIGVQPMLESDLSELITSLDDTT